MKSQQLTRPRYPIPASIRDALKKHNLEEAYRARPPYQRNDYIGWITRAKLQATQDKRLAQMIDELKRGDKYMKMKYLAKEKGPMKFFKIAVAVGVLGLSVVLFIISLFFPAFNYAGNDREGFGSLLVLLIGWMGIMDSGMGLGFMAWYANLALLVSWLGLVLASGLNFLPPKFRLASLVSNIIGAVATLGGIALALSALTIKTVMVNEGGGREAVTMGIGFYLWVASLVICVLGYLVGMALEVVSSINKNPEANQK